MKLDSADHCIKRTVPINDENYYLTVGKNFVIPTVPYENRPERIKERLIVETLCKNITEMLEIIE